MSATITALVAAHLLGDFILLTDRLVEQKRQFGRLLLHVAVIAALSCLSLGTFHGEILLAVILTHLVIDSIKIFGLSDSLAAFVADQIAHLAVVAGLGYCFPGVADNGYWIARLRPDLANLYFAILSCVSGLILSVPVGGILIAKLTERFVRDIGVHGMAGLRNGGKYIGWLERFLVMQLMLINQPAGVGFVIATKSILRFGEIKDPRQRKVAEYIIIGTFLSFGWGLLISVLTQKAIHHWLP